MSTQLQPPHASLGANALPTALDRFGNGCTVLSLDCFDTLLWRRLAAPIDLFTQLPECSFRQRVQAEELARARRQALKAGPEVQLDDIYRQMRPKADAASIARWCDQEIAAEKQVLEAFTPTVELMRQAKLRGLQIIVVSDTYFTRAQLAELLAHVLGPDDAGLIDQVFVSSAYGISKAKGLFGPVLEALKIQPGSILHIGDNFAADYEGAQRFGLRAVHLEQFPAPVEEQLRLEAVCAGFFDARLRQSEPIWHVHRRLLGAMEASASSSAQRLGYSSIGPIIDAFARWIHTHIAQIAPKQGKVRPAFLMRDGHLPELAYTALAKSLGWPQASRIELSRFAAFASSFDSAERIADYLAEFAHTKRFEALGQQLLLTPAETTALLNALPAGRNSVSGFCRAVLSAPWLDRIIERSHAYAARMVEHVRRQSGCEPGDTLLLVDLGYAGTVQDRVREVLARQLAVDVRGAYLLLRDMTDWQHDKAAMLNSSRYDFRTVDALAAYVALLEQMCTVEQASVIGYAADGQPVRKATDRKAHQSSVRDTVQKAALRYIDDRLAQATDVSAHDGHSMQACITTALGALARLLFMPSQSELDLFEGFDHDVNLGVLDTVHLFDAAAARKGLIQRGLFYTNDNPRIFLPAEIRAEGLASSFLLMNQRRHGFDLRASDFAHFSKPVPVLIATANDTVRASAQANPTHDGYHRITVGIGKGAMAVGFQLGALASIIEIHSITSAPVSSFMTHGDLHQQTDLLPHILLERVDTLADRVLRFESAESFLFVPPGAVTDSERFVHLVFRPIGQSAPSLSTSPQSLSTEALA